MGTFLKILGHSFLILTGNFILLYPLMILILLGSFLAPARGLTGTVDLAWLLQLAIMVMIAVAFKAGIYAMIYLAVLRFARPEPPKEDNPPSPPIFNNFFLIKCFFPGVGAYFVPLALGELLQLVVLCGIIAGTAYLIDQTSGIPPILNQISPETTQAQFAAKMATLSPAAQEQISQFSLLILLGLLVYGLFSMLVMLWPAYVVIHNMNAFRAFGRSLLQFARDPLRLMTFAMGFAVMNGILVLFTAVSLNPILLGIVQLSLLMLTVYGMVVLFTYVVYVTPPDPLPTASQVLADEQPAEKES